MRLELRENTSIPRLTAAILIAVGVAMAVCSVLIIWAGASPIEGWHLMIKGALGSRFALSETLTRATPLIFTGLAAAVAFRAKLWNIGGEGQFYIGACVAVLLGTRGANLSPLVMIPYLFAAGAIAGGLFLLVPTLLKTYLNVDEVVTTLLLNFVVLLFVNWLVFGPWKDPMSMGWPQSAPVVDAAMLPILLAKTRLHLGFAVAVLSAVFVWWFMAYTTWGFEMRAVGAGLKASTFAGMPITRTIVRTALLSGGLAAMAGVSELCGVKGYLTTDLSPGFGYTGIVVAMLAALNPLGIVASAIFVAIIYIGADFMSRAINISNYIADVTTAVSLLSVLMAVFLTKYRIKRG
ncbi:MAG: ABC transporter permease [Proteobacteria bacterium]|nr:ABC transporter permease [Desulfobacula sp.]MBU4131409.1 ABC transporter permease [Pseudomonadota bacterium]